MINPSHTDPMDYVEPRRTIACTAQHEPNNTDPLSKSKKNFLLLVIAQLKRLLILLIKCAGLHRILWQDTSTEFFIPNVIEHGVIFANVARRQKRNSRVRGWSRGPASDGKQFDYNFATHVHTKSSSPEICVYL